MMRNTSTHVNIIRHKMHQPYTLSVITCWERHTTFALILIRIKHQTNWIWGTIHKTPYPSPSVNGMKGEVAGTDWMTELLSIRLDVVLDPAAESSKNFSEDSGDLQIKTPAKLVVIHLWQFLRSADCAMVVQSGNLRQSRVTGFLSTGSAHLRLLQYKKFKNTSKDLVIIFSNRCKEKENFLKKHVL